METSRDEFILSYRSDREGRGGQHTNGPDYGTLRCEHPATMTAIEVHTHAAHGQHRAREMALTLCQMAVSDLLR